jgi:hypothetical protein
LPIDHSFRILIQLNLQLPFLMGFRFEFLSHLKEKGTVKRNNAL